MAMKWILLAAIGLVSQAAAQTCDVATTCSNHGFCRSDGFCACYADWFGDACDKKIARGGGITDGGLAGIIVGWLIGLPIVVALVVYVARQYMYGEYDDKIASCSSGCMNGLGSCFEAVTSVCTRSNNNSNDIPNAQPSNHNNNNNNNNHHVAVAIPPPAAMELSPIRVHRSNSMNSANNNNEEGKADVQSREEGAIKLDPANSQSYINQVKAVMGPAFNLDESVKALRKNDWNVEASLMDLLG